MMKNCSRKYIVAFTYVLNACLLLSYFPNAWKSALTVPIRKPNKPGDDAGSYRPISLLSIYGKIFEKILLKRMNGYIEDSHILPDCQFGFRPAHSTSHQVLRVVNHIKRAFRRGFSAGMVLLDLNCAFDTVWHDGLVFKMKNLGFPIYLVKMVQSYLYVTELFTSKSMVQCQLQDQLSQELPTVA